MQVYADLSRNARDLEFSIRANFFIVRLRPRFFAASERTTGFERRSRINN